MDKNFEMIEKYIDVEKLNAISNYLFGLDYNSKTTERVYGEERSFFNLDRSARQEILNLYLKLDRNDVNYLLAKKIEKIGESTDDISNLLKNQNFKQ